MGGEGSVGGGGMEGEVDLGGGGGDCETKYVRSFFYRVPHTHSLTHRVHWLSYSAVDVNIQLNMILSLVEIIPCAYGSTRTHPPQVPEATHTVQYQPLLQRHINIS